ncbi:hypothetical protein J1N35_042077 [Gossypium stocksii]|uniref:Dirigent protein n=1 Tax=Gossypium stocksii TaxID=47602 RepID=A0A9D3ZK92_9ROSI|nr:hypothetical protein J1N35_042077 [Gossypium stocksii]
MASSMLKTHSFIFFLILFFIIVIANRWLDSEVFGKCISISSLGLKRERLSHLHFYFHDVVSGKYNGSTLSVLGRNEVLSAVREMPIVGGSGVFRFARVSGKNVTVVRVTTLMTRSSSLLCGDVFVIDDPLTAELDCNSRMVGKAQGAYALASQNKLSLLMVINFAFMEGKNNGNTLSVLGRNEVFFHRGRNANHREEWPFSICSKVCSARTHSITQIHANVEYNVFVFHY